MNDSERGTGHRSWEVPARPARGDGGAAAAPAAGRRRSADRGAGRWEGTRRGGERQRNAVAAAATCAPSPPPAPAARTINSRARSNARAGAVAPAPRCPGPQALARGSPAPPTAPSPAQHHGPTRTSAGNGVSRRAPARAGDSAGWGPEGGARPLLHPPTQGVTAPRGEEGGEGLPGPPAQLGRDQGWATSALRPHPDPTPAAHGLVGTRAAAAGGSPGHWEGKVSVSARAPPVLCPRPVG